MRIEEKWLPEICTDVKKLGTYRNCTVTAAIGENQASFLGSVGNKSNILLVNMGTGGQISILSDWYFEKDGIEARPFLNGNICWLVHLYVVEKHMRYLKTFSENL